METEVALACISVDLDSLNHYCRIHALPDSLLDRRARLLVYSVALPRFRDLFASAGMPATLFAIGEDLRDAQAAVALREAGASGLEVANHSFGHDYRLAHRPDYSIADDIERGRQAIQSAVGERPVGFRAPGYVLSAAIYGALCRGEYLYDSSVFPAAPYYAVKAAVLGGLAVLGRPSSAVLDSPRVLLAPRHPYFPDRASPYRRGEGPVLELPIATAPFSRIPFIGTFVTTMPNPLVQTVYRTMRQMPFFNFELHGIDLLDAADGVPTQLARRQRDLLIPWARKRARLEEALRWLDHDYSTVTLAQAATQWRNRPSCSNS